MKFLFAHDCFFVSAGGVIYTDPQFSASMWDRYLAVCEQLIVVGREGRLQPGRSIDDLAISSRPETDFRFLPNLSSAIAQVSRRREAKRKLDAAIAEADAVVARLPSEIGLLATKLAERQGKPWAVEVVGCAWGTMWNYGNWQGKVYAPVMALRTRTAISRAKFALYVTDRFLQSRYPNKIGDKYFLFKRSNRPTK